MKQRTSADKPDYKEAIGDNYGNNWNVVFEIQDKEKCFSPLYKWKK